MPDLDVDTTIRDSLSVFVLDKETSERLRRQLEAHATNGRSAHPRRRRIRLGSIGAAAACAAAIVLVVALGPNSDRTGDGSSHSVSRFVGPDTAAARALVRAGDRAATLQWGPLADGEYYHLYSTSVPGDTDGWGVPTSAELWMDGQGRGQIVTVTGTNDPDRLPDPRGGTFWSGKPPQPIGIKESLTKANSANLVTFPSPDKPGVQRTWTRNANGFHKTYDSETSKIDDGGTPDWKPELTMRMHWSITTDRIDTLPKTGGSAMDDAIETLLTDHLDESPWRTNRIPTGAFGLTKDQVDREERIRFAVNLLGAAPLPPEARRSLYRWLAKQPGAKLTQGVTDAIGRPGSRISFEYAHDEQVPADRFSAAELLERANASGAQLTGVEKLEFTDMQRDAAETGPWEQTITRDHEFMINAHRERRTWRITIVIDPETGELLQQQFAMEKYSSSKYIDLARQEDNKLLFMEMADNGSTEHEGGSSLYLSRGIARIDQAMSPVCKLEPKVCRR